jgi:cyclohexanone monooxygenase
MGGTDTNEHDRFDVIVIGAGFAGLYLLHRLRTAGFSVRVLEAGGGVGGTWYWNRYPGARCDVQSLEYSYGFDPDLEQEWEWTEKYATQAEILRYLDHVTDRFDLRRDIRLDTRVVAADFDDGSGTWTVETEAGDRCTARHLVAATGCLSSANLPDIAGRDTFAGPTYHTGRWPHDGVELAGRRVGVIGTGSSGIQSIPVLAEQAEHLVVFQRTPNFSLPAHNRPLAPGELAEVKRRYRQRREQNRHSHGGVVVSAPQQSAVATAPEERQQAFDAAWESGELFGLLATFNDLLLDTAANETAAEYVRERIRGIVADADVAERLSPRTYPIGTKRICLDSGYYQSFNRPNVTLVDLRADPIVEITEGGVRTEAEDHLLDVLVFATGFDAMTGPLLAIEIVGRGGTTLRHAWVEGPRTYLGLAVAGFPNLFTVTGPGSPSVLTNMAVSIEHHVEWITACLAHMVEQGLATVEAAPASQDQWTDHVTEIAGYTLFPRAASWYMGANVPGKPRVFMPYLAGLPTYRQICDAVVAEGYRGFVLA